MEPHLKDIILGFVPAESVDAGRRLRFRLPWTVGPSSDRPCPSLLRVVLPQKHVTIIASCS